MSHKIELSSFDINCISLDLVFELDCKVDANSNVCLYPICSPHTYIEGYNDFYNLALPGRWWLHNFNLGHIYKIRFLFFQPFRPLWLQSLQKVLIWSKKSKMLNFMQFFTFLTLCKCFWPITCFGWTFCIFFQRIWTRQRILRFC